jgi:hypothetical protein
VVDELSDDGYIYRFKPDELPHLAKDGTAGLNAPRVQMLEWCR